MNSSRDLVSMIEYSHMIKLIDLIHEYEAEKKALGHFNFANIETVKGLVNSAVSLKLPIILGLSEGERNFFGVKNARALVDSFKQEFNHPIFLSADHTYTMEGVKEVVEAGFDAIVVDGSKLPLHENIAFTKEAVSYVKEKNPDILVEGEIGYIGTSSKIFDEIPEDVLNQELKITPELALDFVRQTGVDLLSPAVGNLHGVLKDIPNPKIDTELIKQIRQMAGVPLVLHGGSGITPGDFKDSITAGISIIHINTDLRIVYKDALKLSLQENADEIAAYKIMSPVVTAIEKKTTEFLTLFSS